MIIFIITIYAITFEKHINVLNNIFEILNLQTEQHYLKDFKTRSMCMIDRSKQSVSKSVYLYIISIQNFVSEFNKEIERSFNTIFNNHHNRFFFKESFLKEIQEKIDKKTKYFIDENSKMVNLTLDEFIQNIVVKIDRFADKLEKVSNMNLCKLHNNIIKSRNLLTSIYVSLLNVNSLVFKRISQEMNTFAQSFSEDKAYNHEILTFIDHRSRFEIQTVKHTFKLAIKKIDDKINHLNNKMNSCKGAVKRAAKHEIILFWHILFNHFVLESKRLRYGIVN